LASFADQVLDACSKEKDMDCPSKEVLARMPLAEAVLWLWCWVTCEERLESLWDRFRGRCYERILSFSLMVHLIADALLQYGGSGRRSFEKNLESGELEASVQAVYRKLGRLPIPLSQAFLAEGTAALTEAFPVWAEWELPKSLRGLRVMIFDGKAIKRVAKRLKLLRGIPGGLLGGRVLVALDWGTGLVLAMHAHPDGDANDVRFVPELVPVVRQRVLGPRLWMADRAFCDLEQPARFTAEAGDHFLVRYHPKVKFHPDPEKPERTGKTADGQVYVEQWGWLGSARDKRRRYVRRIRLVRPKEEDVILVTDLLEADAYPAEDLLWLYAERWGIEEVFQKVTEVFGLQGLIGGTPQACIFQFAFCLLLYNMIQVVRGYIAEGQDREPEEISTEKLFDDVERQLIAWNVMFPPQVTLNYFQRLPDLDALQARLRILLGSTWSDTWLKSPPQSHHGKTPRKRTRSHNSVYRILLEHCPRKSKQMSRAP
jgi:hypothetical protein